MGRRGWMRWLILTVLLAGMGSAQAQYSRPGLYEAEYLTLDNGLRVVLKPMATMHTTSIRLAVRYGTLDEACQKEEMPHFLEHLMFTGTKRHSEAELETLIESHGGYWNAATGQEYTTYEIDIFDKYTDVGLSTLHEILTESTISPENVAKSRNIVLQELNGGHPWITRVMAKYGLGIGGTYKAISALYPTVNFQCRAYDTIGGITRDDILAAFERYYVPQNMMLVVVGNFDREALYQKIINSFGQLPPGQVNQRATLPPSQVDSDKVFTGTFSPKLGKTGAAFILAPTQGIRDPLLYAYEILLNYLDKVLYNEIRIEHGLAYSPGTDHILYDHFGVLMVGSDAPLKQQDRVKDILLSELDKLARGDIDWEKMEAMRQNVLMSLVHSDITHTEIADYYAVNFDEIERLGYLDNYEKRIKAVTEKEIRQAAHYLGQAHNRILIDERPTLTYTKLYLLLGLFAAITMWGIRVLYKRIRPRRDEKKLFL